MENKTCFGWENRLIARVIPYGAPARYRRLPHWAYEQVCSDAIFVAYAARSISPDKRRTHGLRAVAMGIAIWAVASISALCGKESGNKWEPNS